MPASGRKSYSDHPAAKRDAEEVDDDDDVNPNDIEALSISSSAKNYIMVAAIDFGTTFSGYAFSFKSNKEEIHMYKDWGAGVALSGYKVLVPCE